MLYKLVMITDLNGHEKTDDASVNRVGRIFDIELKDISINERLFMTCVQPNYMKSVITSYVKEATRANDGIIVTTENSMYFLVEKDIAEKYEQMAYQAQVEMSQNFDMNGDPA